MRQECDSFYKLEHDINDLASLTQLIFESQDQPDNQILNDLDAQYIILNNQIMQMELSLLFHDSYDKHNAILSIHSGAGGIDAQDWALILFRMYAKFLDRHNWKYKILDENRGEEQTLKSITLEVIGEYAYGYLKSENGVHRLIRISPFDAEKMRHTSFALVEITPLLENTEDIIIDPKDLRIDTYLASGHGGQGVQTTYSAVRIVHLPTQITVTCQNERSQHKNKEIALKILYSKLRKIAMQEQDTMKKTLRGEHKTAEWGNQIRSYIMQPYRLVKDHRTQYEEPDIEAVLNGKIDEFIKIFLKL